MPRWEPDGVERLQAAAFALFDEQGFERTTVAEIAQRAGLTEIAAALHARGLDPETALLTAGAGMLVQQTAIQRWTPPAASRPLRELLSEALHALRTTVN